MIGYTSQWLNGMNSIFEWVYRLAYVNILWVFFTLLGGIIFGITPATVAMFALIRQWLQGNETTPVFKSYVYYFKNEFLKSNLLGFLLLGTGFILYIDVKLLDHFSGLIKTILLSSFVTVLILYLLILLYIFPIYVHYENSLFQYLKSALLIGISHPIKTTIIIISIISLLFIYFVLPAVSFFYLGSGLSAILMFFSHHLFINLQKGNVG